MSQAEIERYLSGEALIGDDFTVEQIAEWVAGDMVDYEAKYDDEGGYHNHALNQLHAYRHLPKDRTWSRALSLGGGTGEELAPLAPSIERLDVVEPGDIFGAAEVHGIPTSYSKPGPSNELPFEDGAFDLVLGFGVLHHIPNVSFVLSEVGRCLAPGGYACLREPSVSMGDWRKRRPGLTARERGIPVPLFRQGLERAGLEIVSESRCLFAPIGKAGRILRRRRVPLYENDSSLLVRLDALVSRLMAWNGVYHARNTLQQLRPTAVSYVVRKA